MKPDLDALFLSGVEIEEALKRGVRRALLIHKKLGHHIIVWDGEKPVRLPPEEIPVDDSEEEST